jgi:prevent-host-death family protein
MWLHEATLNLVKRKAFKYPPVSTEPMILNEAAAALEETALIVNVRAAKDQLSSLLEQAARGNEVIITSDGEPKAKLVPIRSRRAPFRMDWELIRSMPMERGMPTAEQLVREDRDGRP